MKLSEILNGVTNIHFEDCNILNITLDSRQVESGFLFCAINGHNLDARQFINQTIQQGASAILADSDKDDYVEMRDNIQIIYLANLNAKLSAIAGNFYQHPSRQTKLVGITGTNGKTTVCQLISQWSHFLGLQSSSMGTLGNGLYKKLEKSTNTTAHAIDIQKNIADYNNQGSKITAMEVSSHGLDQNRVKDLNFEVALFTNLSQDHLDYHKTMEEYFKAKAKLFIDLKSKYKIINKDDEYGQKLINLIKDKRSIITVSSKGQCPGGCSGNYLCVNNINYSKEGTSISFYSSWGNGIITTKLIGPFNVSNVLQSLAAMLALGFNKEDICNSAEKLMPVTGRMEVFKKQNRPTIIIDYAHTPDALEKALHASRMHTNGDLWCIFGCGGDRDKSKRSIMAQSAEKYADKIIISNDNPRTENEDSIIEDILEGINDKSSVKIIKDRFSAMEYAKLNAHKTDIILVAGKGHEDYQIFGEDVVHYSDRESACKLLRTKDCPVCNQNLI